MAEDDFNAERDWDEEAFKANPDAWYRRVYDFRVRERAKQPFDPEMDCSNPLSYEEKKKGKLPVMYDTICLISSDHWSVGSRMICEKVEAGQDVPSDAVYQWDDEGLTYCLRKRSKPKSGRNIEGDPEFRRVRKHSTSGIWNLSPNVFCKIMWWTEESTTDATTIRFINKNIPFIPTEEILYDWIDLDWRRSFMLTRRVPGTGFDEAWPSLTTEQRLQIAAQIAKHARSLAELTSDYIETVIERGLEGQHSLRLREDIPEWNPRVEPRVSKEDYRAFLKRQTDHEPPALGERFVLQHPDFNPTNIFVTSPSDSNEAPRVTAIIDWSNVGYLPEFYAATLPRGRLHFAVENNLDGVDWMWMLSNALVKEGFPLEMDYLARIIPSWSICGYNMPE